MNQRHYLILAAENAANNVTSNALRLGVKSYGVLVGALVNDEWLHTWAVGDGVETNVVRLETSDGYESSDLATTDDIEAARVVMVERLRDIARDVYGDSRFPRS